MPNHPRPVVLQDRKVITDTDTIRESLRGLGAVSAIDVKLRATTGATSKQGVYLHDDLDALNVKDGSNFLHSLNGVEVQALQSYHQGKMPQNIFREGDAVVEEETFTISFGRYLGDELYWLDTDMFANPEVEAEITLAISATAGFATGTGRISIIAWVWDEKPATRAGTFVTKEHKSFTSAASGIEDIDLPADMPWRMLLVRAAEDNVLYETDITNLKLQTKGGGKVLLDQRAEVARDIARQRFGSFSYGVELFRTDGDTVDTFLHLIDSAALNNLLDLNIVSYDARLANRLTLQVLSLTAVPAIAKEADDVDIDAWITGFIPHATLPLLIADLNDPDDWLDVGPNDGLRLRLTQGGAGATVQVIGQQVMR